MALLSTKNIFFLIVSGNNDNAFGRGHVDSLLGVCRALLASADGLSIISCAKLVQIE